MCSYFNENLPGEIFIFLAHLIPVENFRAGVKSQVLLRSSCPQWL